MTKTKNSLGEEELVDRYQTVHELVHEARLRLNPKVWDFVIGGAESETTLARNRTGLDSLAFRPRVLRDATHIDTSTTLLGERLAVPIVLAPIGGATLFDPNAALAVARVAAAKGIIGFHSAVTSPPVEEVARHGDGRLISQLYVRGDDSWVDGFIERGLAGGTMRALCITVDSQAYSRRERDFLNRLIRDGRREGVMVNEGREFQAAFSWKDVDRVKRKFGIPIILKGVMTGEDAKIAVDHGIEVVWVSNHGGRQLDHCPGSIEVLAEVVDAVAGRAEVVFDGGVARATDILKALALGAKAVGIGKIEVFALAAAGEAGLARLIDILTEELIVDMRLLGVMSFAELDRSYLRPAMPVAVASVLSAFPLLR